jgi:hypothetical protein
MSRTAATVRIRDGKVSIRDCPFTETKEHLAGFYLIDAADLNDAIQVASQIPPARVGSIEVRPVRELTSTSGERRRCSCSGESCEGFNFLSNPPLS